MFTGALFTFEQVYMAIAATGSGSSSFKVFIRDHTRQLDFCLHVLACSMPPVDLRSEQALGVTTLNQLLLKERLKLQCWQDAQICSSFHYLTFQAGMPFPLISQIYFAVILQKVSVPTHLLSLDTAYHPVGDHLLQRYLFKLVCMTGMCPYV